MSPTVDIHSHIMTHECTPVVAPFVPGADPMGFSAGKTSGEYNARQYEMLDAKLTSVETRIVDMDAMGIDVQALSVPPNQYFYWTDPELGQRLARMQNEHLAEMIARRPDRFVGLATVPMQDVTAAIAELEYCVTQLGFRGVEICTNINGLDLDDARYRPFLAKVEELGVVLELHPLGSVPSPRLEDYYLSNVIGNPLDSTIAATRLILSGALAALPELKLVLVHGGGYLPFYSSRLDQGFHARPETQGRIDRLPSDYLHRIYVDSLVFDPRHLGALIESMGADHVVVGTDYPYDMGFYEPLAQIAAVPGLDPRDADLIRGTTAARLLGIPA